MLFKIAAKFTIENVSRIAFSVDANCFEDPNNEFRVMGRKIFEQTLFSAIKLMIILFVPALMKIIPIS